jgi:hypothetical protein
MVATDSTEHHDLASVLASIAANGYHVIATPIAGPPLSPPGDGDARACTHTWVLIVDEHRGRETSFVVHDHQPDPRVIGRMLLEYGRGGMTSPVPDAWDEDGASGREAWDLAN